MQPCKGAGSTEQLFTGQAEQKTSIWKCAFALNETRICRTVFCLRNEAVVLTLAAQSLRCFYPKKIQFYVLRDISSLKEIIGILFYSDSIEQAV